MLGRPKLAPFDAENGSSGTSRLRTHPPGHDHAHHPLAHVTDGVTMLGRRPTYALPSVAFTLGPPCLRCLGYFVFSMTFHSPSREISHPAPPPTKTLPCLLRRQKWPPLVRLSLATPVLWSLAIKPPTALVLPSLVRLLLFLPKFPRCPSRFRPSALSIPCPRRNFLLHSER